MTDWSDASKHAAALVRAVEEFFLENPEITRTKQPLLDLNTAQVSAILQRAAEITHR